MEDGLTVEAALPVGAGAGGVELVSSQQTAESEQP